MRRMSGITVQVDERWVPPDQRAPGRAKPARKPAAKARPRFRIRWPGALRSALIRHVTLAGMVLIATLVFIAAFPWKATVNGVLSWSGRAGYKVADIYVEGRAKTPPDQLLNALGVKRGDAIFAVDLAAARRRIENISWVRSAIVERRLPDQIHLLITERSPMAIWQNKGRYFLVDAEGQIVGDQIEDYANLPLTVGEGAPDHVAQLNELIRAEPELSPRIKAAAWIGERRWNLTLDRAPDGITVELPEDDPVQAWHDLARLEKQQQLLERQISAIDLRLPDRLVLRAAAGAHEQASGKRKPNGKDA